MQLENKWPHQRASRGEALMMTVRALVTEGQRDEAIRRLRTEQISEEEKRLLWQVVEDWNASVRFPRWCAPVNNNRHARDSGGWGSDFFE
ncbi:hypothetical protein ABIE41_000168 [Bosea sp. OAE506]|uniref:hypothetical protein n=1 Tax=Bosea sp. OAE506 TaxID=2663870 RepID=UPI001789447B